MSLMFNVNSVDAMISLSCFILVALAIGAVIPVRAITQAIAMLAGRVAEQLCPLDTDIPLHGEGVYGGDETHLREYFGRLPSLGATIANFEIQPHTNSSGFEAWREARLADTKRLIGKPYVAQAIEDVAFQLWLGYENHCKGEKDIYRIPAKNVRHWLKLARSTHG